MAPASTIIDAHAALAAHDSRSIHAEAAQFADDGVGDRILVGQHRDEGGGQSQLRQRDGDVGLAAAESRDELRPSAEFSSKPGGASLNMISPKVTVVFVMSLDSFPQMVFKSYVRSFAVSAASFLSLPAISSMPSLARTTSSLDESPLTATAPTTSPSLHTGMPPPQPTNFGSP